MLRPAMRAAYSTTAVDSMDGQSSKSTPPSKKRRLNIEINPSDYVCAAFRANGATLDDVKASAELFFKAPTTEMINAYQPELLNAVRKNDLEKLQTLHSAGRLLNCCNKFGESLLHLACRRGHTEIVRFLVKDAMVDLHIRDDYRRTPLHDACWTPLPNYELVDFLIRESPSHLVMEDVRGFTPFHYVRREHRGKWLRFLWERKAILKPLEDVISDEATTKPPAKKVPDGPPLQQQKKQQPTPVVKGKSPTDELSSSNHT